MNGAVRLARGRLHARSRRGARQTGHSEPRFIRFLRSDDALFAREAATASRWLATKGASVNWFDFARFIHLRLTKPNSDDADEKTHRVSRNYFSALLKSNADGDKPK
ncbi:hypothetical protein CCP2SC5_1130004 [Azospirillaceae bacterium]